LFSRFPLSLLAFYDRIVLNFRRFNCRSVWGGLIALSLIVDLLLFRQPFFQLRDQLISSSAIGF
jgi:hypothetical protein